MCDDFEVAIPTDDNIQQYSHFAYQSMMDPHSEVEEVNSPVDGNLSVSVGAPMISETDPGSAIFFGESIRSLRQLLKRYQFQRVYASSLAAPSWITWTVPSQPGYRGFTSNWAFAADTNTSKVATGQIPYAFYKTTFLSWFMPAFVGYRGSFRHKYVLIGPTGVTSYFQAKRASNLVPLGLTANAASFATSSAAGLTSDFVPGTCCGADLQPFPANPVLEVESPYYINLRWKPTRDNYFFNNNSAERLAVSYYNSTTCLLMDYAAAGDDFSLHFFTNAPVMYYTGNLNSALY
jgi:hypothetical protein